MTVSYSVSIGQENYSRFEKLEGLKARECYEKYGLKRDEYQCDTLSLDNRFEIEVRQIIPSNDEDITYSIATLYDKIEGNWYDCEDCGENILGEWYFCIDDNMEISIEIGIHEDF